MDPFHYKLFAVSLSLLCLLSRSAATTTVPLLPPSSSATLAADTLRSRGYSIFATLLVSMTAAANFSGTLLAPPDSVFSFASAMFLNNHRPPPRPSIQLLLYHTLSPPLILTWPALSTRDDGDELRTFYNRNCLYLLRSSSGEVSISSSPFKNPVAGVKIRQPDLYVDQHLTVHGIDGVLDPSFATKCSVPFIEPMADAVPLQVNRIFLDRAMRRLWRRRYNVVAAAMLIRRSELLALTAVTVLAVSDENLFIQPDGFRYDFRHHVVPVRFRYADLEKSAVGGMELFTLAPNKTVVVDSVDGAVTVDGVAMKMTEVYHNRWIVVLSIVSSLDDVANSQPNPPITVSRNTIPSPSPSPSTNVSTYGDLPKVPSPAPAYTKESPQIPPIADAISDDSIPSPFPFSGANRVPSQAPAFTEESPQIPPTADPISDDTVPSPSPLSGVSRKGNLFRAPSPAPSSIEETEYGIPSFAPAPSYIEESENGVPSFAPANVPSGSTDFNSDETPSPAPELEEGIGDVAPSIASPSSSPSPTPVIEVAENPASSPTPSMVEVDVGGARCRLNAAVSNGVEGGDLLCPVKAVRQLRDDVEESKPLDPHSQLDDLTQFYKSKLAENVNIADDVFFYI